MNQSTESCLERYEPQEAGIIAADPQVTEARISPCGRILAAASFDARVRLWNIAGQDPLELPSITEHNGWVHSVAFHPHEPLIFSSDSWGQIRATRIGDEAIEEVWRQSEAHDGWIRQIDISPDGKRVASCAPDRRLRLWSTDDGSLLSEWTADDDLQSLRFHPNGNCLAAGDAKGKVKLWNLATKELIRELDASTLWLLHRLQDVGGARVLRFKPDGSQLACGGVKPANGGTVQGEPTLLIFDFDSGALTTSLAFGEAKDCFLQDAHWTEYGVLIAVTSGTPGTGKLVLRRIEDEKAFYESTKLPNCQSVSVHAQSRRMAVVTTNRNSNGNGRNLNKDGAYAANNSPIHLFRLGKQLGS